MGQKRVLVVDDEADLLESLGMLVDDLGYAVETAPSGLDALRKLEEVMVDLVLADFKMPGMDGAQLAAEIKKRNPSMPVLLTTSSPHDTASPHLAGFLRKPCSLSELREAIEACLHSSEHSAQPPNPGAGPMAMQSTIQPVDHLEPEVANRRARKRPAAQTSATDRHRRGQ